MGNNEEIAKNRAKIGKVERRIEDLEQKLVDLKEKLKTAPRDQIDLIQNLILESNGTLTAKQNYLTEYVKLYQTT
jgi:hypothetical protein